MGCDYYTLEDRDSIHFSEIDDSICCCCSMTSDEVLDSRRIRALAYLGVAIVLMQKNELKHGFLPSCLPEHMRKEIDRYFHDLD